MDEIVIYTQPIPRQFPHYLRVNRIGYAMKKENWMDLTFDTCDYSFILSGAGTYYTGNRKWRVEAPCVLTQWPGVHAKYGPDRGKTWDELYIVYSKDMMLLLQSNRYADLSKPVWQISRENIIVQQLLPTLLDAMRSVNQPGVIDEIDRICDTMILQSLLGEYDQKLDENQKAIQAIRDYIEGHYQENIDYNELAGKHGLSQATFRRHWGKMFGVPPAQYAVNLRMQNACRLLVETRMSIVSIAQKLGYDDPLYFSRRFHKYTGTPPSLYRRQNCLRSLVD